MDQLRIALPWQCCRTRGSSATEGTVKQLRIVASPGEKANVTVPGSAAMSVYTGICYPNWRQGQCARGRGYNEREPQSLGLWLRREEHPMHTPECGKYVRVHRYDLPATEARSISSAPWLHREGSPDATLASPAIMSIYARYGLPATAVRSTSSGLWLHSGELRTFSGAMMGIFGLPATAVGSTSLGLWLHWEKSHCSILWLGSCVSIRPAALCKNYETADGPK